MVDFQSDVTFASKQMVVSLEFMQPRKYLVYSFWILEFGSSST
jgi:hypothetical protein